MIVDSHVHSKYSYDSEQEPEAAIRQAAKLGYGLCFTEHADYDETPPELTPVDAGAYLLCAEPFRRSGQAHLGIEMALMDADCAKRTLPRINGTEPWDLIIGSVHNTPKRGDPYEPGYYQGRTMEEAYLEYLTAIASRMRTCGYYHVLGHIDYVAKWAPYPDSAMRYSLAPELFDEIFCYLIQTGRVLEFNTSAQKDKNVPLWGLDLLKRYAELGGEAITFASDAHNAARIGWRFPEAIELAKAANIKYSAHFVRGERILTRL